MLNITQSDIADTSDVIMKIKDSTRKTLGRVFHKPLGKNPLLK